MCGDGSFARPTFGRGECGERSECDVSVVADHLPQPTFGRGECVVSVVSVVANHLPQPTFGLGEAGHEAGRDTRGQNQDPQTPAYDSGPAHRQC